VAAVAAVAVMEMGLMVTVQEVVQVAVVQVELILQ
jgi:hypothetical protein